MNPLPSSESRKADGPSILFDFNAVANPKGTIFRGTFVIRASRHLTLHF